MRRWRIIGLAIVAAALIGWVVVDSGARNSEGDGAQVERPTPAEREARGERVLESRADRDEDQPSHAPTKIADTRPPEQRVQDLIAELRIKHEALVTAGATAAAETVRPQIERLERAQREPAGARDTAADDMQP